MAFLNFSEEFEYNPYGVEGYLGQLMQIVYTATSFSTVDSVQFLIEGQKKDYLGSEGVWIGSPLARSSFSK
ncbi:GerMN domain-containing protein [Treponema parvum]|nr:GerMN domain-containing protein [Treponema parvum]